MPDTDKKVYAAINAVQADLATEGISKTRDNTMQGYKFRGIDDVYNVLARLLSKHKICILPRYLSREVTEHVNAKMTKLFYVAVEGEYDIISAVDGSMHTVKTYGEAMDSGDKATNKAMSAAYKYMAFQVFAIPTEGDNDADAHTHEAAFDKATADRALLAEAEKVIAHILATKSVFELENSRKKHEAEYKTKFAPGDMTRIQAAWFERSNQLKGAESSAPSEIFTEISGMLNAAKTKDDLTVVVGAIKNNEKKLTADEKDKLRVRYSEIHESMEA